MNKKPIYSKASTVDVVAGVKKLLETNPKIFGGTRVDVEVIRDHIMKAKISMVGLEYTIFADEPAMIGGESAAPMPFGYFMAGTLLCECAQYAWNAAQLGITDKIYKLEMSIEGGFPLAPLYGMDDTQCASTVPQMTVTTRIESDASPEDIEKLVNMVCWRCPAHQTVSNKTPYLNVVELNGKKIAEFSQPHL